MGEKIEWYDAAGSTLESDISGINWFAQSFTVGTSGRNINFLLKYVKLLVHSFGTPPGNLILSLRNVDSNHAPTGTDIASVTILANTVPLYPSQIEFDFTTFPPLQPGKEYALVLRAPSCDGISNWIAWVCTSSTPSGYSGGMHSQSNNGGSTWTAISQEDVGFEVWGDPTPYATVTDVELQLGMATPSSQWGTGAYPTSTQVNDMISRAVNFIDSACGHDWRLHPSVIELYDGIGYGPKAGMIQLKHMPITAITLVEYWNGSAWLNDTVQGQPAQYPTYSGVYVFYPEKGIIKFHRLRLDGMQVYRVTYTYGYNSPPDFIRDLTATLTAIDIISFMSKGVQANFSLADLHISFPQGFEMGALHLLLIYKANRLLWKAAARRPIGESG